MFLRCLNCQKPHTKNDWTGSCSECNNFICGKCSKEIEKERQKLIEERTCQYCTHEFQDFCSDCKQHIYKCFQHNLLLLLST